MRWEIEHIAELTGYTVEWAEEGNYFLSRRNVLYHSRDLKPPFKQHAVIDASTWKRTVSSFRLAQRLLRFQVTNVIPLASGDVFVTFDKSVGVVRDNKYRGLKGLLRPCRVLRSACAVDDQGNIFFGEYLANPERGAINIYRYRSGSEALDLVYTFPDKSIKHIHGIYFDEFTKSLFCLTGDDLSECRILQTLDGFQTVNVIGQGDETWRAVSMLFTEKYLYYGMDAEFRTNHVFQVDRNNGERKSLGEVSGTVFYSKQFGDELFFSTTAENAPSQKENVAALWHVSQEGHCQQVIKFKKDLWHGTFFQFGTIHFPYRNAVENALYFYLVGVNEDNRTFRVRLGA